MFNPFSAGRHDDRALRAAPATLVTGTGSDHSAAAALRRRAGIPQARECRIGALPDQAPQTASIFDLRVAALKGLTM